MTTISQDKSVELLSDVMSDGISNCCGARVYDPSGEGEGICKACGESCEVIVNED